MPGWTHAFGARVSKRAILLVLTLLAAALYLGLAVSADLRPLPADLRPQSLEYRRPQFLDRHGIPLSVTYDNPWNVHEWLSLHEIPELLQEAFIASEDRRFYRHHGVDWLARSHALLQNLTALKGVRGASTITEQVVRILHPRPRTVWSRLLEGIEAARLEERFEKSEILEFYLNQVPYGRQRRGVLQAARLYFDRDPDTLSEEEMLTLAVLVRAPARLSREGGRQLAKPLARLRDVLCRSGRLAESAGKKWVSGLPLTEARLPVEAGHFLRQFVLQAADGKDTLPTGPAKIVTTLDSGLQGRIQEILDQQLRDLKNADVHNGAVLVVNHRTDEILAWVGGGASAGDNPAGWIDGVTAPRQPGSTLKPFLYGLALDRGWTAATVIDDSPLSRPVGSGMHAFRNYSRNHYGPLRLREALGNSLNIPAIRTIEFVGAQDFLDRLHELGFDSLDRTAAHYGEGLALGNGEVTLLELVRAYCTLARAGVHQPLRFTLAGRYLGQSRRRIYSEEAATLVADILADREARRLEFGSSNILSFPGQTAVKTGTSNDHRDSWAVGFNHLFTVGIWMGNLDGRATDGLTGTTGPGLVLRSIFAELNRFEEARPLFLSPRLAVAKICRQSGLRAQSSCPTVLEKFLPNALPAAACGHLHETAGSAVVADSQENGPVRLLQPSAGLQLIMDPHIPDEIEAYALKIAGNSPAKMTEWLIDGQLAGITGESTRQFMWPLAKGIHLAQARIWQETGDRGAPQETPAVRFMVK